MGEKIPVSYDEKSLMWTSHVPQSVFDEVSTAVKVTLKRKGESSISRLFSPTGVPASICGSENYTGKLNVKAGDKTYHVVIDYSKTQRLANIISISPRP